MAADEEAAPGRERRPTLADVASAASVSISTASRALRDSPLVSPETRQRVVAASQSLGFEPDRLARSLRTRASLFVGVIVPDVATVFYAAALKGAQCVFESAGYQALVMDSERDPEREAENLRTLLAHRVDGLLLATSGGFVPAPAVPVVFFDQIGSGAGAGNVALDNRHGIELLVSHLLEHGHRRIAFLGAPTGLTSATERLEAFLAALARAGLDPADDDVRFGDVHWSEGSGEVAMREHLGRAEPPTAVVAASDTLALGALRAIRAAGLDVPADVALVSFDDPPFGDLLDPPMTALSRHDRELGERAARLLLGILSNGEAAREAEIRVEAELIVRRSCGCVQ
jgi:LacI family transcriptional regulator, galactose operon repressor